MNIETISKVVPMKLEIKDEELLEPLHEKEYHGVKYVIDAPQSILYQIKYFKEEVTADEDDDDFF